MAETTLRKTVCGLLLALLAWGNGSFAEELKPDWKNSNRNTESVDRKNHFGVRLSTGGVLYGSFIRKNPIRFSADTGQTSDLGSDLLGSVALGWGVPAELDFTWLPIDVFELGLGFRYTFSRTIMGSDEYSLPYAVTLGTRYYINPQYPLMAYLAGKLAFELTHMSIEATGAGGFQWRLTNHVALFAEVNAGLFGTQPVVRQDGQEVGEDFGGGLAFSPMVGLHAHF
ncbi:MAG: hypothetical protein AAF471_04690 [Myxococcota bacterium]